MTVKPGLTWRARTVWGFLAVLVVVAGAGAHAGQAVAAGIRRLSDYQIRFPADIDRNLAPNYNLIFDPGIRRAYQIMELKDTSTMGRVIDLDTGRILLERPFSRVAFPSGPAAPHLGPVSAEWVYSLDRDTHELYVAYATTGFGGVTVIDAPSMTVLRTFARKTVYANVDPNNICASASCLPQTPVVLPNIVSMWYVSPDFVSGQHKLLLLLQEPRVQNTEGNFAIQWLAQWDAITGNQEWIYRIQGCQNSQLPDYSNSRFEGALFEGRLGIYVGCLASGGTGTVIQMPVDTYNQPKSELAFPGPLQTSDFLIDPDAEHMLLRASTVNGDSYWVFDGISGAYTGVIGLTLSPTVNASGVDPVTGRLYMLSGRSSSGRQTNPGGLQISDSRRAPAPQPLQFPEYTHTATARIMVDVNPFTGERRVYVRPGAVDSYYVFADDVPVGLDGAIGDLDSLTTDVPEKTGVTGRSFSGIAHGYGFRALLVGGLEGFPTTGPNVGYRVGRHVPKWVGSPCGKPDRELVLGSVREAKLSSSSSNASAAVAETDPGSKTDLGQPTQRCYPRPMVLDRDIWDLLSPLSGGRDYPRPLDGDKDGNGVSDVDEYAGSQWPFHVAECSGDGKDSTKTVIRPLDRGGSDGAIPAELRQQPINADGYTAGVTCGYSKERMNASASGTAFENSSGPSAVGTVRVGRVSSRTDMFRDPARGFVVRTVAEANHIEIGDNILLDEASTVAEAWAAGRSGSASTSFSRTLCGLHIKDELPDQHPHEPDVQVDQNDPTHSKVDPTGGPEISKSLTISACGDPGVSQAGSQPVIDAINKALGSRGRASAPLPDGPLSQGSPGGYIAAVVKDALAKISSESVSADPSTQVPALEITIFNDDPDEGRGRQIYQFAGVDATSTYAIYLLNPEESFQPDPYIPGDPGIVIRPGSDYFPPQTDVPSAPPARRGPLTFLFAGIGFLLRRPLDALLAAAVWAILFSPVQLASRRRALRVPAP